MDLTLVCGCLIHTHGGMLPYLEDGPDACVRLQEEEFSPLLPTDLHIAIFVHPGMGRGGDISITYIQANSKLKAMC